MLVSVIVPVYNVAPYLEEALDSVINQTYKNIEIIIIDDGSTDGSAEICDNYRDKDERIIVVHQENMGLSEARNVGLEIMCGDAVAFFDSDDALDQNYIREMAIALEREKADVVVCDYKIVYTTGRIEHIDNAKIVHKINQGNYGRIAALKGLSENTIDHYVWNKLYDSKLWDNVRFPVGHVYEDTDTTFRIINKCKIVYVLNQPLYFHRKREGSITGTNTLENHRDWILAYSHFYSFVENNYPLVFSEDNIMRCREFLLKDLIVYSIMYFTKRGNEEQTFRNEIMEVIFSIGESRKIEKCAFQTKVAYRMVTNCPWLLWIGYSIYRPFRAVTRIIKEKWPSNDVDGLKTATNPRVERLINYY